MIQKVLIDVDLDKPLGEYGEDHVILYDNTKKRYYVTTRESILREQNEKIEALEKEFEIIKKEYEEKYSEFIENSLKQYNEFLKTYKETNGKMIEMVKTLIVEE